MTYLFRTPGAALPHRYSGLAMALVAGTAAAVPQDPPAEALSFEQLSALEVSGVSKSVERILDAPAAVTVITSEDIRAYGFRTLGEVLTAVPGYFYFSDLAFGYAGVHGFAPIGSTNSRVLLLIDGFPTNDNIFEQALLGQEAIVDLALIDHIEVIRGPGSSIYGANAFFGVINVVLKTPSQVDSGAAAWLGSNRERGVSGSLSGGVGSETRYLLSASTAASAGPVVRFDPQPGLPQGAHFSGVDGSDVSRVFAKIMDGNLRMNLGFSERRQQAGYGLHGDVPGDPRSFVRDGDSFADVHYEGTMGSATDYVLRASLAQYRYDALIVDDPAAPNSIPAEGSWIDTEATATHHLSPHSRLVMGLEVRRDLRESLSQSNALLGTFQRLSLSDNRLGAYAQSDIDWSSQWSSSIGVRGDSNDGRNRADPRLAVLWKPSPEQVVKLMAGSAFRQPSVIEQQFAQPGSFIPDPDLTPERVRTVDLEYQAQVSPATHGSVTLFRYRAIDLISQSIVDPVSGAMQFQNVTTAQARGVDLSLEHSFTPTRQLSLSASFADATDGNGNWLQNSPRWTGRLALRDRIVGDCSLAGEALYEGPRLAFDNSPIAGFTSINLALSSVPRRGRWSWSLGLYNLLDARYSQPLAGLPRVTEPGLTARVGLAYTL